MNRERNLLRGLIVAFLFLLTGSGFTQDDQEDPKPEEKAEIIEFEFKVGKRPPSVYNLPGFKYKDPLQLTGEAADAETLREKLEPGLRYILERQQADGSWKYNSKDQVRRDKLGGGRGFLNTAADTLSRTVLTSLCCMALRSHEELAPKWINEAVAKGLDYVIESAPKHKKARYGVWTWSFAIRFMVGEYDRTSDEDLRQRIRDSVAGTAKRLLDNQHKGTMKPPDTERPDPDRGLPDFQGADPRDKKTRKSRGGYLGMSPSEDGEIGKVGVLVASVAPNGPISKGGLRAGDRILEINGVKLRSVDHLYELADSLEPASMATVKILREAGAKAPPPRGQRRQPQGRQPSKADGGWSYYTFGTMTFTTATAVMSLMDAKRLGADVPRAAINRGLNLIEATHLVKDNALDGFSYQPGATFGPSGDMRGSIGRIGVCELALLRGGRSNEELVARAIRVFVKLRGELDRVKGYPGNHSQRNFMNAAYYWLYSHFYTSLALNEVKDAGFKKRHGAFIQEALLKSQLEPGTWVDHEAWGQLSGTALGLMGMGQLKFVTPDAYSSPIKKLKKRKWY